MAPALPVQLSVPWSHVKAEQPTDTQYPHVGQCRWIPGCHAARRNKRNLVILWVRAHRLTCEKRKSCSALRCLWAALGGKSIIAERAISVQHEIVTDISHPTKRLSCLWFSSHCVGRCFLGKTTAAGYFSHQQQVISSCLKFHIGRYIRTACHTVWWASHFLKWVEHVVPCIMLFFNDRVYFWRLRSQPKGWCLLHDACQNALHRQFTLAWNYNFYANFGSKYRF